MNCPYCSKEMEKGTLCSRGGLFFLPEGETVYLYTKRSLKKARAIALPPDPYDLSFFPEYPVVYCCRDCRKIMMDYTEDTQK